MKTFLTTPRMNPALARRVQGAVAGRKKRSPETSAETIAWRQSKRSWGAWVLLLASATAVTGLFLLEQAQARREMEQQRAILLDTVAVHRLSTTAQHARFLEVAEGWIEDLASSEYKGDLVAADLGNPGELDAWLARPAVYLHGAARELGKDHLAEAASTSIKDAFLLCLVDPPASRAEKDLLSRVRGVNFGGAVVDLLTFNIRSMHEAEAGLSLLGPAWEARVRAASSDTELAKLAKDLERAPLEKARAAGAAELLIVVADDVQNGETQAASVALVDIVTERVLLRVRKLVDRSRQASPARALYGASLDNCELALDVRAMADSGVAEKALTMRP